MNNDELNDNSLSDALYIIVDKFEEKNGWTSNGYSFSLISKNTFDNKIENKISLNVYNYTMEKAECVIPSKENISTIDCLLKNHDLVGKLKFNNSLKINNNKYTFVLVPQSEDLNVKSKGKTLSTKAKIGILVALFAFIIICFIVIIIYKKSRRNRKILKQKKESNEIGYIEDMDKYGKTNRKMIEKIEMAK